mgnify:CR=1 FL=1|jgi:hypothetical protein
MLLAVMKTLSAVAAMLGLCACETFTPPPEPAVRKAQPIAKIDVRSIPTGCVVELNDEYLGVTPLEVVVDATESGNWASQGFGSVFVMKCSMPDGDGWERKVWYPGHPVPKRVLFRIPGATRGLAFH